MALLAYFALLLGLAVYAVTHIGEPPPHMTEGRAVSISEQRAFMLANPITTINVLFEALAPFLKVHEYIYRLGWHDTYLSLMTQGWWATLAWLLVFSETPHVIRQCYGLLKNRRISRNGVKALGVWSAALCCVVASALLNSAVLYMADTPVGADYVFGLQARYFYPQIILAIACVGGMADAICGSKPGTSCDPVLDMGRRLGLWLWGGLLGLVGLCYSASLYIDIATKFY